MKRSPCMILALVGIFNAVFNTSAWSVNNFLMTGPKAYLTYSTSVAAGAQRGIEECKHQFAWERWNCPESTLQLSTHNKLRSATKETSFVHAISSAGVMYALTRNCSMGEFENCGCDSSRNGHPGGKGWVWGGCSDNVEFGERISKVFVDALETGRDTRASINLHNNEAGRLEFSPPGENCYMIANVEDVHVALFCTGPYSKLCQGIGACCLSVSGNHDRPQTGFAIICTSMETAAPYYWINLE